MKHLIVPHIWDDFSMGGKTQMEKRETCGPPVLIGCYLVRNKRTGYDLKKPNDFAGGSGGYAP